MFTENDEKLVVTEPVRDGIHLQFSNTSLCAVSSLDGHAEHGRVLGRY